MIEIRDDFDGWTWAVTSTGQGPLLTTSSSQTEEPESTYALQLNNGLTFRLGSHTTKVVHVRHLEQLAGEALANRSKHPM